MIRQQQAQIQALTPSATGASTTQTAIDDSTPTSERSLSIPPSATSAHAPSMFPQPHQSSAAHAVPSHAHPRSRSPIPTAPYGALSRNSSYRSNPSQHNSPSLRPMSGSRHDSDSEWSLGESGRGRDEAAFYQAETQMLTRENQMLKMRIRELERQLLDASGSGTMGTAAGAGSQYSGLASPPLSVAADVPVERPVAE